jgi:hypothetical protein
VNRTFNDFSSGGLFEELALGNDGIGRRPLSDCNFDHNRPGEDNNRLPIKLSVKSDA